jgi:hypothetical protein
MTPENTTTLEAPVQLPPPSLRAVQEPDSLSRALVRARARLQGTVYKSGTNTHQKYRYVGHEDVLTSGAREALLLEGLALVQTDCTFVGEVPGGKAILLWRGAYQLLHESGETLALALTITTQSTDKAGAGASTTLDRVMHLRLLSLAGSSEEDDDDDRDHARLKRELRQQGGQAAYADAYAPQEGPRAPEPAQVSVQAPGGRPEAAGFVRGRPPASPDWLTMFLPKIRACKTRQELGAWLVTMKGQQNLPQPVRAQLWASFKAHCITLQQDADDISRSFSKEGAK